jgi:hypothetical protein
MQTAGDLDPPYALCPVIAPRSGGIIRTIGPTPILAAAAIDALWVTVAFVGVAAQPAWEERVPALRSTMPGPLIDLEHGFPLAAMEISSTTPKR